MRDHATIQAAFLEEIETAQLRIRVTKPCPPDETINFRQVERVVGLVNDKAHALSER